MLSTVLVVDDDPNLADTLAAVLNTCGHDFLSFTAHDVPTALKLVGGIRPDLVILAALMADSNNSPSLEHVVTIREIYGCKVLLMSWYPSIAELLKEAGIAPIECFAKPANPRTVIAKVREVLSESAHPECEMVLANRSS